MPVTIPATGSGTATPVVATDSRSSEHYQKVAPYRRGTAAYDSGRVAVGDTLAAVTTATVYPKILLLTNITGTQRWFKATNTANGEIFSQFSVAPWMTVPFSLHELEWIGIKMQAEIAGAIIAQVAGEQA